MPHSSEIINFINGPEAQRILRFMCFEFIKEAQFFRALGDDIPKEAEGEQAFFMSKLLRYAATHGPDYLTAFNDERKARFAPYKAVGAAIVAFGEWHAETRPMTAEEEALIERGLKQILSADDPKQEVDEVPK